MTDNETQTTTKKKKQIKLRVKRHESYHDGEKWCPSFWCASSFRPDAENDTYFELYYDGKLKKADVVKKANTIVSAIIKSGAT